MRLRDLAIIAGLAAATKPARPAAEQAVAANMPIGIKKTKLLPI
ncbi:MULTISPECIES: hypothetical protein [Chromobacterium]|nr:MULTISPECIES: hypothetical protein [Chromobacterium]WSE92995.1 hypothetical protein U6115_07065 [Chromobacterium subtsugae]WVH61373.1 hypothetical protein U6151_07085 [Chromobacterium subtsugae]